MLEFLLAASRTAIIVTSLLLFAFSMISVSRVWQKTRDWKAVFSFMWEHADKLATGGVMIGYLLLVSKQPFIPAGLGLSLLINVSFLIERLFQLRGQSVGYMVNFWTARGTKRVPVKNPLLQTQI